MPTFDSLLIFVKGMYGLLICSSYLSLYQLLWFALPKPAIATLMSIPLSVNFSDTVLKSLRNSSIAITLKGKPLSVFGSLGDPSVGLLTK